MFYKKIEALLEKSSFIKAFDEKISQKGGALFHNLNRSAKAMLLARAFEQSGKSIIFVTADDKLAEDYLDDLEFFVGHQHARFLPDYEVLPYEERSPHYTIRAERIETLATAVTGEPTIYSLSLRALLRHIVPAKIFQKNMIYLKQGQELDLDILVSNLVGMGFENQYQVSKVGEIARRGGIIDIFPPNLHNPVRIEFFGDEIESIRVFSVINQRSTGDELEHVSVLPSREFSLHDIDTDKKMWEKIHEQGFYEGIELDASLVLPSVETFWDYFPKDKCLIFWDEFHFFQSYMNELWEETTELYEKIHGKYKTKIIPLPDQLFLNEKELKKRFTKFSSFFLSNTSQQFPQAKTKLRAPITSQDNFHGELDDLEIALNDRLAQDFTVYVQSDNSSQRKRMQDLLPDFEEKVHFSIGVLQKGFNLTDAGLAIFTDHEIFSRYRRKRKQARFSKAEALVDYDALSPGDYIVHIEHGIGIYAGLRQIKIDGSIVECLMLKYAGSDVVYVPTYQLSLVTKFVSEEGIAPQINKLGSKKWENSKSRAKKQIELVAQDLVNLYAERKLRKGIAFEKDNEWQREMENSFIYEDTPDQRKATNEIKEDMESDQPMERLLCGDVGFGKTEVAIRAAFKAVVGGYQCAILVPTTLLAEQHYLVFKERLAQYPVQIAMFSRFRSKANIDKDVARCVRGEVDIAIGTHRILSKDMKFKRLGLLIVDEEHRFGVRHKDKLRQLKSNVDTLYMSATPIPRTMYMALSKLKEMSLIRTSPKARLPIRTVVVPFDNDVIKDAINREVDRGGQVFFVHNRVQTIESIVADLQELLPNVRIGVGHGQLPEKQLEAVMIDFAQHKFDVLVASTIIETGIDIPNANTMIINRADMFGLAQLYQIRGRVGRSNRRAYAYLMIPPKLTPVARKRLETLIEYESLGSGYQIAMRDMELRGAGTLLGTKQNGMINTVGFNYYNRLLAQAIQNIEQNQTGNIWEDEAEIVETRMRVTQDHYLPSEFISDEKERLDVYKRMVGFKTEAEFIELENELKDRFGEIPAAAKSSMEFYKLRMLSQKAGLASFNLSGESAVFEFDNKRLPTRHLIAGLLKEFDYPVKFETVGNLKINFDFSKIKVDKTEELFAPCRDIITYLLGKTERK